MEIRQLGSCGLKVPALCFGTASTTNCGSGTGTATPIAVASGGGGNPAGAGGDVMNVDNE